MASLTKTTPMGNLILGSLVNMTRRPVGVWYKNWDNIQLNISRNVGGLYPYSDGWGGPSIGELADPDSTEKYSRASYLVDFQRQMYPNYADYVREEYGATLSVQNINAMFEGQAIPTIDPKEVKVGVVGTKGEAFKGGLLTLVPVENVYRRDTILGQKSLNILNGQIKNAEKYKDSLDKERLTRSFSMMPDGISGVTSGFLTKHSVQFGNDTLRQEYTVDRITSDGSSVGDATTYVYDQGNNGFDYSISNASKYSRFKPIDGKDKLDIIDKTNKLFQKGVIKTLVSSFHTEHQIDKDDVTATSWSGQYGYSRGRNLLKREKSIENGYENPYCRVWTNHHQYHRLVDAIRPFNDGSKGIGPGDLDKSNNWKQFRSPDTGMDGGTGGGRLQKFGVINYKTNGLVNITPVNDGDPSHKVDVKSCMFSIENLAWKGVSNMTVGGNNTSQNSGLSNEQKGPFGGRIMWFPPYGLKFDETTNAQWGKTDFIGRGESIYTYANTSREGHLSFKLLIDHPSIIDYWKKRTDLTDTGDGGVDDINSSEQTLLRFFAGCDMLSLTNAKTPEVEQTQESEPEPEANSDTIVLTSFLFFPNNYTGTDDGYQKGLLYLMNGMGAGRVMDRENITFTDYQITTETCYGEGSKIIGGYEVRPGNGISARTTKLDKEEDGYIASVKQGESGATLALGVMKGKNNSNNDNEWYKEKWAYRVDTSNPKNIEPFIDEDLKGGPENYIDKYSYGFNSGEMEDDIRMTFGIKDSKLYAFTDLYVALSNDDKINTMLSGHYNTDKVETLKSMLNGVKNGYEVANIKCTGYASSTGNKNQTLSKRRTLFVAKWLRSTLIGNDKDIETPSVVSEGPTVADISSPEQKIHRCCRIDITLKASKTVNAVDTEENTDTKVVKGADTNSGQINQENTKTVNSPKKEKVELKPGKSETLERYDNEAEFFRLLELNEPVIHHKIVDKIKYFDPAFHSISPEGFNARLTFLQQCMRQGATVGGSDLYTSVTNANNLAYGRPPVCILRIGDFYYTKIIITSLQIEYDTGNGMQWDLNTEGIGVMPMMANVTLNFNFIGGSSLRGPIDRLQNALSFNMYANTEVYDNRSDQVDYDNDGKITNYKAYVPK